jgi:hypothetical protein
MPNEEPVAEEVIIEEVDLEEYARDGKEPPLARKYHFNVNETRCTWEEPTILGRQILEQADLTPPHDYILREKMKGGTPRRVELDEKVNLRKLGVEKFRAIKKGQTEGDDHGEA